MINDRMFINPVPPHWKASWCCSTAAGYLAVGSVFSDHRPPFFFVFLLFFSWFWKIDDV